MRGHGKACATFSTYEDVGDPHSTYPLTLMLCQVKGPATKRSARRANPEDGQATAGKAGSHLFTDLHPDQSMQSDNRVTRRGSSTIACDCFHIVHPHHPVSTMHGRSSFKKIVLAPFHADLIMVINVAGGSH